jgi:hypothetical protein
MKQAKITDNWNAIIELQSALQVPQDRIVTEKNKGATRSTGFQNSPWLYMKKQWDAKNHSEDQ